MDFRPIFQPVSTLNYVGSFFTKIIQNLCGERIIDVLLHLPMRSQKNFIVEKYQDLYEAVKAGKTHVCLKPFMFQKNKNHIRIVCEFEDKVIDLVFFKLSKVVLEKMFPVGKNVWVSGEVSWFDGKFQMNHPKKIKGPYEQELEYPLTKGLTQNFMQRIVFEALKVLNFIFKENFDWLSDSLKTKHQLHSFNETLQQIHAPQTFQNPLLINRLAFDEMLAYQLILMLLKDQKNVVTTAIQSHSEIQEKALSSLPFELTVDQKHALEDIRQDMFQEKPMSRLLQGDVGSGKTIVAFLSMLAVIQSGFQCAFVAPTEILAKQHYEKLKPLADNLGITLGLFLGAQTQKQKDANRVLLSLGQIQIAIGTHALFQEGVVFESLKYVVIDEQHRFGVEQRLELKQKGINPHTLMMTATPIPRTMVMVKYGDLDLSFIKTKPAHRKPILTSVMASNKEQEVMQSLERVLEKDHQVYWVCPLIEDSEKVDLMNVQERFQRLKSLFGDRVALLHGKMKSQEKEDIMKDFAQNKVQILVTTTVIEVGVDVKNAVVMIIENAQRFGLSQLHQLRGRVGRSDLQSYCILLYDYQIGEDGKKRLEIMRKSDDGFELSEMDLTIRGMGDVLGVRQSGFREFRFFDFEKHQHFLDDTIAYAKEIKNDTLKSGLLLKIFKASESYGKI